MILKQMSMLKRKQKERHRKGQRVRLLIIKINKIIRHLRNQKQIRIVLVGDVLASKVYNQFVKVIKTYIWPFIALMIAMIVANEMIVYSVPVRIIFFLFTFFMVWKNALASLLLPIFYILKGGYSYYTNQMTDGPKQRIMPTIYSLLPITTYKPTSKLGTFVLYPFTYPKTEEGAIELPEITKDYWKSLVESLKDYSTVKGFT